MGQHKRIQERDRDRDPFLERIDWEKDKIVLNTSPQKNQMGKSSPPRRDASDSLLSDSLIRSHNRMQGTQSQTRGNQLQI